MNILFILTNYPGYGGIEKVTSYITDYLSRNKDYYLTIFSYGTKANELLAYHPKRIRVEFAPIFSDYMAIENAVALSEFIKHNSFDYVVLQDSYAPLTHIITSIKYPWKSRLIVVEHNTPLYSIKSVNCYFYAKNDILYVLKRFFLYIPSVLKAYIKSFRRHRFLVKNSYKYVLLSESYRQQLFLMSLCYGNNIISIANPLTISSYTETKLPVKKKQFLFVGRLNFQKGLSFLLQIWKEFSESDIEGWDLVILGGGDERERLIEAIMRDGIKHIRIDNPTYDINHYYQDSEALLMTSIFEGFPLVLAEAMSRGCIPIAFDTFSSLHDIVENEKNGFIIKPFMCQQYVACLKRVVNDSALRNRLSSQAIIDAKKFSLDCIGRQWINLFENVKEQSNQTPAFTPCK